MKTKTPYQVMDEIAQDQIGRDIDLSLGLQAKIRRENEKMLKTKVFITVTVVVMFVFVMLISIPGVAQAMKRLLGYLPGVGFVNQSIPLRVLKEPVQSKEGETTISVKQAIVDTERTIILYQVENVPATNAMVPVLPQDLCQKLPWLQLVDGTEITAKMITGDSWVSGYSRHLEFPALPTSDNAALLVFPCLEQTPVVADTQNWKIPLIFIEASPQMTIYPIVDILTPTTLPTTPVTENQPQPQSDLASQISLSLKKYVQTNQDILLFSTLNTAATDVWILSVDADAIHLTDVNGNEIPLIEDHSLPDPEEENSTGHSFFLTYRSSGKYTPGQATLTIDSVLIGLDEKVNFTFDPGSDPQPGQKWNLNKSLKVAGRTIIIKDVQLGDSGDSLAFTLETPEDVAEVNLMDLEHPLLGGGGGEPDSAGFTYRDGFPDGQIEVTLASISLKITGPWQATINLPEFSDGNQPTQIPTACLTQSTWNSALKNKLAAFPEDLPGKLILSSYAEPDFIYKVVTSNLDGSNQTILATGNDGSLSPDKKKVVYASSEGLKLLDLSTGITTAIPDTTENDQGPIWSPDGSKIAFTRKPASRLVGALGANNLMIMDADGSNQSVLLENNDANIAQAWLADGQSLLYTVKGPEGASIRTVNIKTGLVNPVFDLNYLNAGVTISPDGKRLAYEEMLPGDRYSVYISDMDGSNQKFIANADPIVVTKPQWSPNGQWLILSVQDTSLSPNIPVLALVQVDTCQIVPLTSIKGYVTSWR